VELDRDVPTAAMRAAIVRLAGIIEAEDGAPPLSDDAFAHLSSADVMHVVAHVEGQLAGYAQRRDGSAEVAGRTDAIAALLDAVAAPELLIWAHGRRSRLTEVLDERGATAVRELHQLRRPLTDLPSDPPLADGVTVRQFRPGADELAWLVLNAAAFAMHREQGQRTLAELQSLMSEPWFDAAGFLLAERDGELLGFHWTKVHADGTGEVYVLGVGPAAQGLGLGKALLARGLRHLADRGCREVLLYVDGDNTGARKLYQAAGFREHDLDVQWQLPSADDA
jgi:mycothiol synthase